MGWNGSGGFTFTYNWVNDTANGIPITASRMDTQFADAVTGFQNCITRDGQGYGTSLIPFSAGLSTDILRAYTASGPVTVTYGQLKFPAVQNPSSDVNTLDDYEEGSWVLSDVSGASLSLVVPYGNYIKIGKMVYIAGGCTYPVTANGGGAALSLPFTAETISRQFVTIGLSTGVVPIGVITSANPTFIALQTVAAAAVLNSDLSNTQIAFSGCYQASA
jgi:hypothetical protein